MDKESLNLLKLDSNLPEIQRKILIHIDQCGHKICIDKNRTIANSIGCSIQHVSNSLHALAKKGYIDINLIDNNNRHITINQSFVKDVLVILAKYKLEIEKQSQC